MTYLLHGARPLMRKERPTIGTAFGDIRKKWEKAKMAYKLTFAGSGSAFTVGYQNYQSNLLLESENGVKLLIDCGTDARLSLYELGFTYRDIEHVYISHLHADHAGGLEWLGFTRYFDAQCTRPTLYLSNKLVDDLWERSLAAGLSSLEDRAAQLNDFFDVKLLKDNESFLFEDCSIKIIKTIHICNYHHVSPCYGLFITLPSAKIYITADTQFHPELLMPYYEQADVIFHDCDISKNPNPVHSNYQQLCSLPDTIKEKMWLYHYEGDQFPDYEADHFRGFAKKGQEFTF